LTNISSSEFKKFKVNLYKRLNEYEGKPKNLEEFEEFIRNGLSLININ
jgi:hypothetical protein